MEKSRKYKVESEKGSVTLYILVAMLFFLVILILTYSNQANKISDQRRQVEKIYEEYKTEEKIEQEYYEVEGKLPVTITLYKPSGEIYDINEWTNQDLSLKIFYPGGIVEEAKYFYLDGIKTKYQEGLKITKNSKIEVDDRGHKAEVIVTRIDKELPTVEEFKPDVLLNDKDSLSAYGIDANVIALPGHTDGSIGLDVENTCLIAGDALMNMFYPTVSLLFHNKHDMLESAGKISRLGNRRIYFGHGKPVSNKQWVK